MDETVQRLVPRARQAGLVVRELDEETVVYDLERDQAHCLGPTAALIWKHCDGQTTVPELVALLQEELSTPVGEDTVWQAIVELGGYHLLEEQVSRPAGGTMSRRELMRRAGIATVVGLPLITSLAVPTAAMAASCSAGSGRTTGCPCAKGSDCASLCCVSGTCQDPTAIGKVPDGGTCNGNGNCCSIHCHVTAGHSTGTCVSP
ncbi:MAG TPA: PqqD family protein [Chloroflexota bacterium]